MATKIHYPITTEVLDQTGLTLCGRHKDGRYQYRSYSVLCHANIVTLSHSQRVGLAVCFALAKLMRPGVTTEVFPMSRHRVYSGFGVVGHARLWLAPPLLDALGRSYLADTIPKLAATRRYYPAHLMDCASEALSVLAHEMGHNTQHLEEGGPGKPHGAQFKVAESKMRLAMRRALSKGWPKLDMRKLRDSVAPHLAKQAAKKKRQKAAACESREFKWQKKVAAAERNLEKWRKALAKAERMVVRWEKALRHCRLFLAKAQAGEESE